MNYILYEKKTINFFIEYIDSIVKNNVNFNKIEISKNLILFLKKNNDNKNKFIFLEKIPSTILILNNILINCFLVNTEQMTRIDKNNLILSYPNEITIIDYSSVNYEILKPYKNTIYLPYQINYNEIYYFEKIKQICMIGLMSSRRIQIFNKIKQFDNIDIIKGWGVVRDNQLFKYKILVNIHFNFDYNVFEQLRCNRCIFNKIIVITEKSYVENYELKDYIIECEYNQIVNKVLEVSKNYDFYYNKLFSNFNLEEINNKLQVKHNEFMNLLN